MNAEKIPLKYKSVHLYPVYYILERAQCRSEHVVLAMILKYLNKHTVEAFYDVSEKKF